MHKQDFKMIGGIALALGILLLVGATYAEMPVYQKTILGGYWTTYPNRQYTFPLLLSGITLLVIGTGFLWRAGQKEPNTVPKPPE